MYSGVKYIYSTSVFEMLVLFVGFYISFYFKLLFYTPLDSGGNSVRQCLLLFTWHLKSLVIVHTKHMIIHFVYKLLMGTLIHSTSHFFVWKIIICKLVHKFYTWVNVVNYFPPLDIPCVLSICKNDPAEALGQCEDQSPHSDIQGDAPRRERVRSDMQNKCEGLCERSVRSVQICSDISGTMRETSLCSLTAADPSRWQTVIWLKPADLWNMRTTEFTLQQGEGDIMSSRWIHCQLH